jgi:hypothetical protein
MWKATWITWQMQRQVIVTMIFQVLVSSAYHQQKNGRGCKVHTKGPAVVI